MLFLLFSHALIEHQSFTVDFNPNCSEFMTLNGQQDYLYLNKTNELHLWIMQNTSKKNKPMKFIQHRKMRVLFLVGQKRVSTVYQ